MSTATCRRRTKWGYTRQPGRTVPDCEGIRAVEQVPLIVKNLSFIELKFVV